ncbi:type II secretion system protein GspL [Algiphilus sp.]|uniref:type II secretion system protein GspL n=1 Tax=Algiphilus sp. TaxID=1872431 RepID=UPI003B516DF9
MRQTLYIHLRDADSEAPLAFRVDGAATGSVQHAPLHAIAEQAPGARLVVFVPAASVRFLDVELPVRNRRRALAAAPFACEDRLAEDIDQLHFAHLGIIEGQRHGFAVISHVRMRRWMERLAAAGLHPDLLLPDSLCLPPPDEAQWSVHLDHEIGQLYIRHGLNSASVTQPDALDTLLTLSGDEAPQSIRVVQRGDGDDLSLPESIERQRQPEFGALLDLFVRYIESAEHANLLQGDYAPQSNIARYFRPWRAAALFAALTMAGILAHQVADTYYLRQQAEAQQQANVQRFQQLFPGYSQVRAQQLPSFLRSEMRSAQEGDTSISVLTLLDSYVQAAQASGGLRLEGMQWRDQTLLLNLRGESLENLEALRGWYRNQQAVAMTVENADAGSEGVRIRIRLSGPGAA